MKKLITILLLSWSLCHGIALGAEQHANVLDLYAKGKYADALKLLQAHLASNPGDLNAHYYLANCYVKLGEKERAKVHYHLCLLTSPNGKLAQYCKAALNSLEGQGTEDDYSAPAQGPFPINTRGEQELQNQVNERQTQMDQEKQAQINSVRQRHERERQAINAQLQSDINAVPKYFPTRRGPRQYNYDYDDTVEQLKTEANKQLDRINDQEKHETDGLSNRYDTSGLNAAGSGLFSQIHSQSGNVQLTPQGTNLYIRNYLNAGSAQKPTPDQQIAPPGRNH